uniref:Uncharacterized protein n=1 Tax=Kalanchoe fedtschenkoi TaxID=63787 RepID=A0A7N0UKR8_KALFE
MAAPPQWMLPPNLPASSNFWVANTNSNSNLKDRYRQLHRSLLLAKTMKEELEMLPTSTSSQHSPSISSVDENTLTFTTDHLSLCVQAANSLVSHLTYQLEPFRLVADESGLWEDKSVAVSLANKFHKTRRNKQWRKRKRKRLAEMHTKQVEHFDLEDHDADEWRAKEIANDMSKQKLEKLKEIAKLKAKEEKKQLESELELVLIVEKLQELRSLRIEKLKKQGHFLPEEDNKFLERVRAAVEEEERIAMLAAETDTTKEVIETVEESRRFSHSIVPVVNYDCNKDGPHEGRSQNNSTKNNSNPCPVSDEEPGKKVNKQLGHPSVQKSVGNLPMEFYHYYHGSNTDLGTLIEVRGTWDAYIRPEGSRVPGHWIEPPPPANEVWASYLLDLK